MPKNIFGPSEIVQDLKERIKELEESIANKDTIQKMLKGLFHNGLKASKQPNLTKGSEEPVKDLGVLGRRKQTAENAPRDAGGYCHVFGFSFY